MLSTLFSSPIIFLASTISIILAISVHEAAHAWAADRLGDPTPRLQGRLTLNPLAHLDPIGTLMLVLFRFGWGKPVIFDPFNLKNPRRDAMLIGLAGPASNLISATLGALLLRLLSGASIGAASILFALLIPFITISVALAIFNLVPVHPLDGEKILIGLLPRGLAREWELLMRQWGIILLLMLIFPFGGISPIFYLIGPVIGGILDVLLPGSRNII